MLKNILAGVSIKEKWFELKLFELKLIRFIWFYD